MPLSAEDKMYRAKTQLQMDKPFFSYLTMYLKCQEKKDMPMKSMGVDMMGNLYYDPDFVIKLTEKQLEGVLVHEVMHIVLQHIGRGEGRDRMLFNISNDLKVNDILITDGIELPPDGLITRNHSFQIDKNFTLNKIDELLSEEIYDQLYNYFKKKKQQPTNGGSGSGQGGNGKGDIKDLDDKRFDNHDMGKNGKKKGDKEDGNGGDGYDDSIPDYTPEELEKARQRWKQVLAEAANYARMRGMLPAGMERLVDGLLESKVDWRHKLYKYVTDQLPYDFSWSRPSKKSFSTGVYMPHILKEKIEVIAHIDTSGSIGEKELQEFLSEINAIARSFSNIEMNLLIGDADLQAEYKIGPGYDEVSDIKVKGGGGTSHDFVRKWIEKNRPTARILISLTDGYSDIQNVFPQLPETMSKVLVMPANSMSEQEMQKYAEVIKLG